MQLNDTPERHCIIVYRVQERPEDVPVVRRELVPLDTPLGEIVEMLDNLTNVTNVVDNEATIQPCWMWGE